MVVVICQRVMCHVSFLCFLCQMKISRIFRKYCRKLRKLPENFVLHRPFCPFFFRQITLTVLTLILKNNPIQKRFGDRNGKTAWFFGTLQGGQRSGSPTPCPLVLQWDPQGHWKHPAIHIYVAVVPSDTPRWYQRAHLPSMRAYGTRG